MAKVFEDLQAPKKQDKFYLYQMFEKTMRTIKTSKRHYYFRVIDGREFCIFDNIRVIFSEVDGNFRVFDEKANGVMFGGHDFTDKTERKKICDDIYAATFSTGKKEKNKGIFPPQSLSGLYGLPVRKR